jgi:hypothetical protein
VRRVTEQRAATQPGKERTVRAVLDLVSRPDDALLTWTEYPWVYLNYRRVAASRWIWGSFMLGQIYLGRASPEYVLPKTWEWFAQDVQQSKPKVFLEETANPLIYNTPFTTYVRSNFEQVYTGSDNNIYLRHDAADQVLRGAPGQALTPLAVEGPASRWTVSGNGATLAPSVDPALTDVLELSASLCTRISGTYTLAPSATGDFLSFRFDRPGVATGTERLNIVDSQIFSGDDSTIFDSTYLGDAVTDQQVEEPGDGAPVAGGADGSTGVADAASDPPDGSAQDGSAQDGSAHDGDSIGDPSAGYDAGDSPGYSTSEPGLPTDEVGPPHDTAPHEFSIVVGRDSAAIVIDGAVRAAVRLTNQTRLAVEMRNGGVTLADLHRGDPPQGSGCS